MLSIAPMTPPSPRAAIVGIAKPTLSADEAELFHAFPPAGVILFARNIQDPAQLAALIIELRRVLPQDAEIMVDQEGGRVARLKPPHWHAHPSAAILGGLFETNPAAGLRAAWLTGALIGLDCRVAGFTVAATPVLDIAIPGAHAVIGDRAFAQHPDAVARLGRAVANGLLAAGVLPVGKHAPGHGRARVDSHLHLPKVDRTDLTADIRPFALNADLPWMMTAHIVYDVLDPHLPATLSATVIETVIRGRIGFEGVLVTDDLAMKALSGPPADLAVQALAAGCDIALYCSGDFAPTQAVLRACPTLTPAAEQRLRAGRNAATHRRLTLDPAVLAAERQRLLA
ncbi:beta-N-acetylhexosaminidase [Acidisphaera sp. S103]|uniref:beta-N-acetylhexosaminidase n=1 Tax=Acidisphaera sp. S103 TaxID=1747223 RepID=UPI0020B14D70|nr:beta-N-acetylhexosaminidase [Acidisphaera sp. S103]